MVRFKRVVPVALKLMGPSFYFASFRHVCYDKSRNERADFYRRFCQDSLQSGAFEADGALYANLANAMFARFYARLLIPRLGT